MLILVGLKLLFSPFFLILSFSLKPRPYVLAFFLIFVLISFSWEPMYKSILIAFLSWKLTFLGNPSVNLGQQKGFLLKIGRETFQRFLWVDGDFSYWVSFLEVVKMPLWDGWAYKAPKHHSFFAILLLAKVFQISPLWSGWFSPQVPRFGGIICHFQSFSFWGLGLSWPLP